MNKIVPIKDQNLKTKNIKKEIMEMWNPISHLNVIINNLRANGAHVMAARLSVHVDALEGIQADGIRKFIGLN